MGDGKQIERFRRGVTKADLHFGKLTPTVPENRGEKHTKEGKETLQHATGRIWQVMGVYMGLMIEKMEGRGKKIFREEIR